MNWGFAPETRRSASYRTNDHLDHADGTPALRGWASIAAFMRVENSRNTDWRLHAGISGRPDSGRVIDRLQEMTGPGLRNRWIDEQPDQYSQMLGQPPEPRLHREKRIRCDDRSGRVSQPRTRRLDRLGQNEYRA
jgi:hypothetical protein